MDSLISVLIPVYNEEKYIEDTLKSVLNQDYRNIEVIVVNDGSKDESGRIIETFDDRRIRYYYQENKGIGYTRNRLLTLAKGEYILFVDSDDILSDYYISSLCSAAEEFDADIASSSVVPFRRRPKGNNTLNEYVLYSGEEFALKMVRPFGEFCYAHSRLFRSSLFASSSFREDKIFEDVFLLPSVVMKAERVVKVKGAVYNYRINPEGLSHGRFRFESLDEMDGYLSNFESGLKIGVRKMSLYSGIFFLTKYYYYFWKVLVRGMGVADYRKRFRSEAKRIWKFLMRNDL